jgi:HK97 family phage prohead protease
MPEIKKNFVSTKNFIIVKSLDEKDFIVAGYASTPNVDKEGDIISLMALKEAFPKFMQNVLFRNVQLKHSNTQIGLVLDNYLDRDGTMWESKIDDKGLFIVVSIRDDIKKARLARQQIRNRVLKAFSIGGEPLEWDHIEKDGVRVREIKKLQLHEITICEIPMNSDAEFQLLKAQNRWKRLVRKSKDGKYKII